MLLRATENTSDVPLGSLPDFIHNSSDENVDKEIFEAPGPNSVAIHQSWRDFQHTDFFHVLVQ
jgi:hypothetical protein